MNLVKLNAKLSRFVNPFLIRKLVFLGCSIALVVCAILGSFYFQLLLNNSLATLLGCLGIIAVAILTVMSLVLSKKDGYKMAMMYIYATSAETKGIKNTKELMSTIETAVKDIVGGYTGFQSCVRENKELLGYMTTGMTAFEEYSGDGLKTKIAKMLSSKIFWSFTYFAVMDLVITGQASNHSYRIASSTRWFPVRAKYIRPIKSIVLPWVGAFIGWVILANVLVSSLATSFGFNSGITSLLWMSSLGLVLQVMNFRTKKTTIAKMAMDLATPDAIAGANYDLCLAFADISQGYYNACVECGYIQVSQGSDGSYEQIDATGEEQTYLE